jgi:Zn-dependent protease
VDATTAETIARGLTSYVVMLFSLSFHESAHAWAALRMGDDTAQREGRISLNPLVHIDPIGTVLMPLLQFLAAGIPLLAWAKPTPYNPANFRREVSLGKGHVVVAGAGPISNLVLALAFVAALFGVLRLGVVPSADIGESKLLEALMMGVYLNVALALFNLVPVPPLDGSKVAAWSLPRSFAERYEAAVAQFGPLLLLIVLIPVARLLSPVIRFLTHFLIGMAR